MKIVNSIRDIYDERKPVYDALENEVDSFFIANKEDRWHYESRVKKLLSFALKAETGRVNQISKLEDFFGACLVVENSTSIQRAIEMVQSRYEVAYRRPRVSGKTHKDPSSFVFDDLRLYLRLPSNPNRRTTGLEGIVFELQIKTFLQHAWSIATHDLVYKGSDSSWASSRISYQVKAMLEHAELSIAESDALSKNPLVNKTNKDTTMTRLIINYLRSTWPVEQLPEDLIRLSANVLDLINKLNFELDTLKRLSKESKYIGNRPRTNLSPYSAIALTIFDSLDDVGDTIDFLRYERKKIFLPDEAMALLTSERSRELDTVLILPN